MPTAGPKTFAEMLRRAMELEPIITSVDFGHDKILPTYTWTRLEQAEPEPDIDGTEPDECGPAKTLNTALARLTALEDAVAPVISVFREYLADSFLPDDARVLIDELPLAGLCHGDLRQLMAVWDAGEDEGAAAEGGEP